MTPASRAGPELRTPCGGGGRERHYPLVVAEPTTQMFRAACSCGWRRHATNAKRENAIRAARRHCQEAG